MKTAQTIGSELSGRIKGSVQIDLFNRVAFSTDASIYRIVPQCVVSCADEEDVVAAVRYAAENSIPLAPRGAGSGLAGESLTSGIVLDMRRHMNAILETAHDGSWVRVQPGVVLDRLNTHLAAWGRKIGPDPSSGNRAVIGGVVANNATGAHSLQYGYIADHVRKLRAVMADGAVCQFGRHESAAGYAGLCWNLLESKQDLITRSQPATKRNRCGYTIQNVIEGPRVNMARLLTGSEGTLAVFTEITLETVKVPAAAGLLQFEFDSLHAMASAVPIIVQSGAAACELMDRTLMDMVLKACPAYADIVPPHCAATLLVEHTAESQAALEAALEMTVAAVGPLALRCTKVLDKGSQARLWKSRKDAVPLLNREKGPSHPVAFIEDVSVDHRRLGEYTAGLLAIGKKYDIPMAFYGHAGDGELHIRPYLDLSRPDEVRRMRSIAEEVFALAWSLGGTISGEHADGLLRAAFIEKQYGAEYYELLKAIKKIFDPAGILNPGKIVSDDPAAMESNLRAPALAMAQDFKTDLCFRPGEFRFEMEQCNGCGVCLASAGAFRMCPVFGGTNDELGSSRAKTNLIASWLAGEKAQGTFDPGQLKRILTFCINCKMCSIECPAGVDVSKLVIETRAQLARHTGFTRAETVLSNNRLLSLSASAFAPLSNKVMGLPPVKALLEKTLGLDRTRRFPAFQRGSFIRKAQRYLAAQPKMDAPAERIIYFVDSFVNWNDHELGFAVLKVLHKLGVEVAVPRQRPAPLPAYVYGNLKLARKEMLYNLQKFEPYLQKGYKVICSEPSAALCLRDELRLLIDTRSARLLSENTFELMDFIAPLLAAAHGASMDLTPDFQNQSIAYHCPCHLKALRPCRNSLEILKKAGLNAADLNSGCCGLAGTAGMQAKNCDLTAAIGRPLKEKIDSLKPDLILTECAACKMQIEHLTGKPVKHPIKLLAKALQE
ncbi:MAG: FAD-binding protein [Planctomycetaceae bacterium]|nr:FAD-binding protein [Planctomycetaceae bacterium]